MAQRVPPEMLEIILKDVVQDSVPEERALVALGLSHVCGSFRHAALDCPRLWASLSRKLGRPGLALIDACIERSGDQPLDVVLHVYASPVQEDMYGEEQEVLMAADNILQRVLPHSSRWRSCSILLVSYDSAFDQSRWKEYTPFSEFQLLPQDFNAPILEDFSIVEHPSTTHHFPFGSRENAHIENNLFPDLNCPWIFPNLRSLTIQNCSLVLFPSVFSQILRSATVKYSQCDVWRTLKSLISLSHKPLLTTLQLSFHDCRFSELGGRLGTTFLEFPNVKILRIELLLCTQMERGDHSIWMKFRSFYFPSVVEMNLIVDLGSVLWDGHDMTLHSLLATDLHHAQRYPSLETLDVTLLPRESPGVQDVGLPVVLCLYGCIPSLKHIKIQSPLELTLAGTVSRVFLHSLPAHYRTGGETDPLALQTITLDLPCVRGVVTWVKDLSAKMRDLGCWDGFSGMSLVHNGERDVVSRDDVEHWCEANENKN